MQTKCFLSAINTDWLLNNIDIRTPEENSWVRLESLVSHRLCWAPPKVPTTGPLDQQHSQPLVTARQSSIGSHCCPTIGLSLLFAICYLLVVCTNRSNRKCTTKTTKTANGSQLRSLWQEQVIAKHFHWCSVLFLNLFTNWWHCCLRIWSKPWLQL